MFDPHDFYERHYWHYESRHPLSMAQIIALQSVDAETVALIWLLLEHGASLTVAGPTDPQPGVGKTTTLNALLQFLPEDTAIAYMSGMYEDFAFTRLPDVQPAMTWALCNEVSNHLPIYMWGRVARRYLQLPGQGYHVATSVHADTIHEVLTMYQHDLHLRVDDIRRLGIIVNIGLVGRRYAASRRWFTTHFLQPVPNASRPQDVIPVPLSLWNSSDDSFEHADSSLMADLATWIGMPQQDFLQAFQLRVSSLRQFASDSGIDMQEMYAAIQDVRSQE